MATNPHFTITARITALDGIDAELTTAVLVIYAGVQPADASAATTAANVSVARLSMAGSAFGAAANAGSGTASMTAGTITDDSSAAGGTAAWFSLEAATGNRVVDGSVGVSAADLILNAVTIATGATVSVSSFVITMAA